MNHHMRANRLMAFQTRVLGMLDEVRRWEGDPRHEAMTEAEEYRYGDLCIALSYLGREFAQAISAAKQER